MLKETTGAFEWSLNFHLTDYEADTLPTAYLRIMFCLWYCYTVVNWKVSYIFHCLWGRLRVYVKVNIHIYISIAIGLLWEHCIILTLEMCPCAIRLRYHLTPDRSWYKLEEFHRRSSHCVTMYCMCKLWSVCLLWETRGTR